MSFQLTFSKRQTYTSVEVGITIDALLKYGGNHYECLAKVDTGAEVCLFAREIGELLGLDIERGLPKELGTLTGSFTAYGHEVTLETLGIAFQSVVYFPKDKNWRRNLLGREGWLRLVRLAIVDYDEEVYLNPYEEQS